MANVIRTYTQSPINMIEYPIKDNPVSEDVKDLIYQMLRYEVDSRISFPDILKHKAIVNFLKPQ